MHLNPRLMKDTLTVERLTPAPLDPNTGLPMGGGATVNVLVTQPASDQDQTLRSKTAEIVNGVVGSLPVSRCFTAWFPWPDAEGGEIIIRVNGSARPLIKQGPPREIGGQHQIYELWLGSPTGR
ncbi:hypothetical protein [Deinococcus humi]|uniref:Uncharacterized protein n=1 Tax=Deinococcus humi TaxID=662880 RepID=A0A7W8ND74_9DEIO|nr:hypothetical protein [Deinococcus humi]MBB5361335.1 hypothetical protein [Deinococcus humi]GGO19526.1 hypothetical protein GCM10008949_03990 [Deinococcus humi]